MSLDLWLEIDDELAGNSALIADLPGEADFRRWAEAALAADFSVAALAGLAPDPASMASDMHGDADYRAALVAEMTRQAVAHPGARVCTMRSPDIAPFARSSTSVTTFGHRRRPSPSATHSASQLL